MNIDQVKLKYYRSLVNMSYKNLVVFLQKKHGPVRDDYFREKSYARFLAGEIKHPVKGKVAATDLGLYTHHVAEDRFESLGLPVYIQKYQYPFSLQRKEMLVYADIIEHTILHAVIIKENPKEYSGGGYVSFLEPMFYKWYVKEQPPRQLWNLTAYKRAFISKEAATILLQAIRSKLLGGLRRYKEISERVGIIVFNLQLDGLFKPAYTRPMEAGLDEEPDSPELRELDERLHQFVKELVVSSDLTDTDLRERIYQTFSKYLAPYDELKAKDLEQARALEASRKDMIRFLQQDPRNITRERVLDFLYQDKSMSFKEFKRLKAPRFKEELIEEALELLQTP